MGRSTRLKAKAKVLLPRKREDRSSVDKVVQWQVQGHRGWRNNREMRTVAAALSRAVRRNCKRFDVRRGIFLAIEISKYQIQHFYMME